MSTPEIIIRFDRLDHDYSPGQTLSGEYRVEGIEPEQVAAVEVSVVWYTEGKGDHDMAVHEFWRNDFDRGEVLVPNRPQRFSTALPLSPLSYDGQIVKIRWCVRVRVLYQRGKDLVAQKLFSLGDVPPAPPMSEIVEPTKTSVGKGPEV